MSRFNDIMRFRIIITICLLSCLVLTSKAFAIENDSVYDAIIGGMDNGLVALDQALVVAEHTTEAKLQRLEDLGYPDGYDPGDPVAMGEVDPYEAMQPDIDEIMTQEAMEAWEDYNQPEEDISDRIIKP